MGAWQARSNQLLSAENLLEDVLASLNAGELALRRFREVARISGLIWAEDRLPAAFAPDAVCLPADDRAAT